MNRKLYQSKPFETEEINVVDTAERLARVNASDCRRATGPVSVVIQENTEDSLHLSLCDGIQSLCRKVPIQEIQNHPPILHKHNYHEMTFVLPCGTSVFQRDPCVSVFFPPDDGGI